MPSFPQCRRLPSYSNRRRRTPFPATPPLPPPLATHAFTDATSFVRLLRRAGSAALSFTSSSYIGHASTVKCIEVRQKIVFTEYWGRVRHTATSPTHPFSASHPRSRPRRRHIRRRQSTMDNGFRNQQSHRNNNNNNNNAFPSNSVHRDRGQAPPDDEGVLVLHLPDGQREGPLFQRCLYRSCCRDAGWAWKIFLAPSIQLTNGTF